MEKLLVKKMRDDAIIPTRATDGSAGFDLYACIDAPVEIEPHKCVGIPSGIAISLPDKNCAAFVFARSGLARKHGIAPVNAVGVIDSDYRGEIKVALYNQSKVSVEVQKGDRIAQMIIADYYKVNYEEALELDDTARGEGGFGSTGKN